MVETGSEAGSSKKTSAPLPSANLQSGAPNPSQDQVLSDHLFRWNAGARQGSQQEASLPLLSSASLNETGAPSSPQKCFQPVAHPFLFPPLNLPSRSLSPVRSTHSPRLTPHGPQVQGSWQPCWRFRVTYSSIMTKQPLKRPAVLPSCAGPRARSASTCSCTRVVQGSGRQFSRSICGPQAGLLGELTAVRTSGLPLSPSQFSAPPGSSVVPLPSPHSASPELASPNSPSQATAPQGKDSQHHPGH